MIEDRRCGTCKWAKWPLDKRGRPHKQASGRCGYPLPEMPPLPSALTHQVGFTLPTQALLDRQGVWRGFATDCPTWEKTP